MHLKHIFLWYQEPFSNIYYLGEIDLICWSTGASDPILNKNKKILRNFGLLVFFYFILFFSAFLL